MPRSNSSRQLNSLKTSRKNSQISTTSPSSIDIEETKVDSEFHNTQREYESSTHLNSTKICEHSDNSLIDNSTVINDSDVISLTTNEDEILINVHDNANPMVVPMVNQPIDSSTLEFHYDYNTINFNVNHPIDHMGFTTPKEVITHLFNIFPFNWDVASDFYNNIWSHNYPFSENFQKFFSTIKHDSLSNFTNILNDDKINGFFLNPPFNNNISTDGKKTSLSLWSNAAINAVHSCKKKGWITIPIYDPLINENNLFILENRYFVKKLFRSAERIIFEKNISFLKYDSSSKSYVKRVNGLNTFSTLFILLSPTTNYNFKTLNVENFNFENEIIDVSETINFSKSEPLRWWIPKFLKSEYKSIHDFYRLISNLNLIPDDFTITSSKYLEFVTFYGKCGDIINLKKNLCDNYPNSFLCSLDDISNNANGVVINLTKKERESRLKNKQKPLNSEDILNLTLTSLGDNSNIITNCIPFEFGIFLTFNSCFYEDFDFHSDWNSKLSFQGLVGRWSDGKVVGQFEKHQNKKQSDQKIKQQTTKYIDNENTVLIDTQGIVSLDQIKSIISLYSITEGVIFTPIERNDFSIKSFSVSLNNLESLKHVNNKLFKTPHGTVRIFIPRKLKIDILSADTNNRSPFVDLLSPS